MDAKPSFHKLSNDAASRKYRRHSPLDVSDSSSSDGSPKIGRNCSPAFTKEDYSKTDSRKKEDEDRDLDRNSNHSILGRGGDSQRHFDRHEHTTYHDCRRRDDHKRHQKNADEEERNYRRSSRSGQESRDGKHSDHTRPEISSGRSRGNDHSVNKYSKDKSEISKHSRDKSESHAHKSKEATEYRKHNDRYSSSGRVASRSRHEVSHKEDMSRDRDHYRNREDQDEKRERHRSRGDYRNDSAALHEEVRAHAKDSRGGRDSGAGHRKEMHLDIIKDIDKWEDIEHKRKTCGRDYEKGKVKYACKNMDEIQNEAEVSAMFPDRVGSDTSPKKHKSGHLEKQTAEAVVPLSKTGASAVDGKLPASSKQKMETGVNINSEPVGLSNSQAEAAQDFSAAKVAAMKAADLVNRNLVGGGFLSTDQKKKLLWGNKNTSAEETGNRWDLSQFSDRERQEKFNKLMSLRLPWYLWPILGCEGRSEVGAQTRRKGCGETGETPDGLGEAIHCWTPEARWQNRWSWPLMTKSIPLCTQNALFTTLVAHSFYFLSHFTFMEEACCLFLFTCERMM